MRQRPGRRPRPRAPAAAPRSRLGRVDAGASGVDLPEPLPYVGTWDRCALVQRPPHTFSCPPCRSRSALIRRVPAPDPAPRAESVRHLVTTCRPGEGWSNADQQFSSRPEIRRSPAATSAAAGQAPRRLRAGRPGMRRAVVRQEGRGAGCARIHATADRNDRRGGETADPSIQLDQHAVVALAHAAPHVAAEHRLAPDGRTG
jgi:hypothetical protein